MRIIMLLITIASLCHTMEPASERRTFTIEGHPLVLTSHMYAPKHTVTGIHYREYSVYRHEEKIKGRKKCSYTGSIEIELGYDEDLTQKNARKIFIALMAKVKKQILNLTV